MIWFVDMLVVSGETYVRCEWVNEWVGEIVNEWVSEIVSELDSDIVNEWDSEWVSKWLVCILNSKPY